MLVPISVANACCDISPRALRIAEESVFSCCRLIVCGSIPMAYDACNMFPAIDMRTTTVHT
jgi:hypothetical protein